MSDSLKLPTGLSVVGYISAYLGMIQSMLWISLFAVGMHSYLVVCPESSDEPLNPADLFGKLLQEFYFTRDECEYGLITNDIRKLSTFTPFQVFAWAAIGLAFCSIWLSASIVLLFYIKDDTIKSLNLVLYTWCVATIAVTVIDLTQGILFGMTYHNITQAMIITEDRNLSTDYDLVYLDLLRLASLLLMSISLRGFVMIIINFICAGSLFWFTLDINKLILDSQQHSIFTREPINAFMSQKQCNKNSYLWQSNSLDYEQPMERSARNGDYSRGYQPEAEDRSTLRSNVDREPVHRQLDRPDSWRTRESSNMAARPFTYLAESRPIRSPNPVPAPAVPNVAYPPWKRYNITDLAPPVPNPDYSPIHNRKLKSVLKTGYN